MAAGDHKGRPYRAGRYAIAPPRAAEPTGRRGRPVSAPYIVQMQR